MLIYKIKNNSIILFLKKVNIINNYLNKKKIVVLL